MENVRHIELIMFFSGIHNSVNKEEYSSIYLFIRYTEHVVNIGIPLHTPATDIHHLFVSGFK